MVKRKVWQTVKDVASTTMQDERTKRGVDLLKESARRYTPRLSWFMGDKPLWIIIAIMAIISILVVYSSTAKMAYDNSAIRSTGQFLQGQIFALIMAAVGILITHRIDSKYIRGVTPILYGIAVALTLAVYVMGNSTNGAARWFSILGFQFQPSEVLKITSILMLVRGLALYKDEISTMKIIPSLSAQRWNTKEQRRARKGFIHILLPLLFAIVVITPAHTSSALLLFIVSLFVMVIGRVQFRELRKLILYIAIIGSIYSVGGFGRSQTAGGRFSTWYEIWTSDRTTTPVDELADTERSMIAIHNGGMAGVGAGRSAMRVEMIHPESDYAYAFFVEEYGLLFACLLIACYLWIFYRAMVIFMACEEAFPSLMVIGIAMMITCQAFLHIAVALNLSPETGQTLPLISRGGTSLLFNAMALGLILSVSRQYTPTEE